MKTNHHVKIRDRKISLKTLIVIVALISGLVFSGTYYSLNAKAYSKPQLLNLEIQPQNMKLGVNQSGTWWVLIHNGTTPYSVEWVFDGKVISSETSVTFTPFSQPSNMTTLIVHVTDAQGNSGFASTTIYDPATINVYLDDLPSQAYFTVKNDVLGNCWAVRHDGYKAWESTNATTIINNALAGMTAGRDWKETVVVRGSYSGLSQIRLPSYTVLEIQGELCAKALLNTDFIVDLGASNSHIEIFGGKIDGNGNAQTAQSRGIHFSNVAYASVHDLFIQGGHEVVGNNGDAIRFYQCTYSSVHNVHGRSTTGAYDVIKMSDSDYCTVSGNIIDGTGGGTSRTIQASLDSTYITIVGNTIYGSEGGIKLHDADFCTITGNTIGSVNRGIWFLGHSHGNIVSSNVISECGYGIDILSDVEGTPSNNTFSSNQFKLWNSATGRGVRIISTNAKNNTFFGNMFFGNTLSDDVGVWLVSWNYDNIFTSNSFDSAFDTVVNENGTRTRFINNIGYCTSNYGTAPNTTATTFVFYHNLATTPLVVFASFSSVNVDSWTWIATTTQITITVTGSSLPSSMTAYWDAKASKA